MRPPEKDRIAAELGRVLAKVKQRAIEVARYCETLETRALGLCVACSKNDCAGDELVIEVLELIATNSPDQHVRDTARAELARQRGTP